MWIKNLTLITLFIIGLSGCNDSKSPKLNINLVINPDEKPEEKPYVKSNNKPEINNINLEPVFVGDNLSYQVIAFDKDGDILNYKLANCPSWLQINSKTGLISGTPSKNDLGTLNFNVIVSDGKISETMHSSLVVKAKLSNFEYDDEQQVIFSTKMKLPQEFTLVGHVNKFEKLFESDYVNFNNIKFIHEDGQWYIINNTFMPLKYILITYGSDQTSSILTLSSVVNPYTRANISFSLQNIGDIKYQDQLLMFNPVIALGAQKDNCSDKTITCYNSPRIGPERETFERTLGHIHDSFNKISFVAAIEDFFKNNCKDYEPCLSYNNTNRNDLSYGYRNYLSMGLEGHKLSMRAMRNVYRAEGVGGGGHADISYAESQGSGWASIWENYVDVNESVYRILPIKTLFHEIAHAYSFNHASGMTYGFADYMKSTYIPQQEVDISSIPYLHSPDIIVNSVVENTNLVKFSFLSRDKSLTISEVKLRVASNKPISFNVSTLDIKNKNTLSINFKKLPENPVYIQVWDNKSTYVTTKKFTPYDLMKSLTYIVGNKTFVVLSPELLHEDYNGWKIRQECARPHTHLATKDEYQELYDYLYVNNQIGTLPFSYYLSSDEPSDYLIWQVEYNNDATKLNKYSMHNTLGKDNGLVCVTTN
ncbi:TPA: putative Ig domain-containing protein [Photobacterium damselae]